MRLLTVFSRKGGVGEVSLVFDRFAKGHIGGQLLGAELALPVFQDLQYISIMMYRQQADEKCPCGNPSSWYLQENGPQHKLICGSCEYSQRYATLPRISASQYMLDKLQRPQSDLQVLDTYERIDSSISELIDELKFLREAHISSHPELALSKQLDELKADDSALTPSQLQKLIAEAKKATQADILNPSLREQLTGIIGQIGELWKPQLSSPQRVVLMNTTVDEAALSQVTPQTVELILIGCKSSNWVATFKHIAKTAAIRELHLEKCRLNDSDILGLEAFNGLAVLNLAYNLLTNEAVAFLEKITAASLRKLMLTGNKLNIGCLNSLSNFTQLIQLDISEINQLNTDLEKLHSLTNLESLYLYNNAIKSLKAEPLAKNLPKLKVLDLTHNPLNQETKRQLQKQLPFAMI